MRPPLDAADGLAYPSIRAMSDDRIQWVRGATREGPMETIGVLELCDDGRCRAVLAERVEVDGRCHVLLARQAWGGKGTPDARWWSLVLDDEVKAYTVRNGSCGDPVRPGDVPRIARALEELGLAAETTMIAVDKGCAVFPWRDGGSPTTGGV